MEELTRLRAELGVAVRELQRSVDAVDEAAATAFGVNRTDLRCLDLLLAAGELTPGALSTELGLSTGSVTAMVDRLERQGYVTRTPSPADRRKLVVRASDAAREKAAELYDPVAAGGGEILTRYSAQDLATIIDFLTRDRELQDRHAARIRGGGSHQ